MHLKLTDEGLLIHYLEEEVEVGSKEEEVEKEEEKLREEEQEEKEEKEQGPVPTDNLKQKKKGNRMEKLTRGKQNRKES